MANYMAKSMADYMVKSMANYMANSENINTDHIRRKTGTRLYFII
jgi:hypothetical protein